MKKILSFTAISFAFLAISVMQLQLVSANEYDDASKLNHQLNATTRPDHIALSWTDDPRVGMTISWRASSDVERCEVEYKEDPSGLPVKVPVKPEHFQAVEKDASQGEMNLFSVTLTGLKPGSRYTYRISNDRSDWTVPHTFTTEGQTELIDNKFKFLVFGDSQSGKKEVPNYNEWHDTVKSAFIANQDAKFFMSMGDLVETGQSYMHWNNWYNAAKGVIDTIPDMPVQGNHETYNGRDFISTKPVYFTKQFRVFQNGPEGLRGQTYSFNYGKTHFVILDSQGEEESLDAEGKADPIREQQFYDGQVAWLKKDLEQNRGALFTLVFFHKTPYYNKGNRTNIMVKKSFCPVFDLYHVDVVFNGHDHATSRTYPINNDRLTQSPSQGTVYFVTGRSGAKYYADLTPKVWDAKFYDPQDQPDYQTVELDGGKLTIKAFRQDGTVIDEYVIDKAHPENNTSNHEVLPSTYNSDSIKLILFGSMAYGSKSQAAVDNGKAYADIRTIASYAEGEYSPDKKTLVVNKREYEFTPDMLIDHEKKVSIDALNNMGWANHYDTKFNMVFIEK